MHIFNFLTTCLWVTTECSIIRFGPKKTGFFGSGCQLHVNLKSRQPPVCGCAENLAEKLDQTGLLNTSCQMLDSDIQGRFGISQLQNFFYWSWTIPGNSLNRSHKVTQLLMSQLLIQSYPMSSSLFPFIFFCRIDI